MSDSLKRIDVQQWQDYFFVYKKRFVSLPRSSVDLEKCLDLIELARTVLGKFEHLHDGKISKKINCLTK